MEKETPLSSSLSFSGLSSTDSSTIIVDFLRMGLLLMLAELAALFSRCCSYETTI